MKLSAVSSYICFCLINWLNSNNIIVRKQLKVNSTLYLWVRSSIKVSSMAQLIRYKLFITTAESEAERKVRSEVVEVVTRKWILDTTFSFVAHTSQEWNRITRILIFRKNEILITYRNTSVMNWKSNGKIDREITNRKGKIGRESSESWISVGTIQDVSDC